MSKKSRPQTKALDLRGFDAWNHACTVLMHKRLYYRTINDWVQWPTYFQPGKKGIQGGKLGSDKE